MSIPGKVALGLGLASLAYVSRRQLGIAADVLRAEVAGLVWRRRHPRSVLSVPYIPGSDLCLDLFAPLDAISRPVIVYLHGGGWNSMRRELFACSARQWVRRGLVVIIPDYTLYPRARYEQMAGECAAAVAWAFAHCREHGGDPEQVYVLGHSAGGHLGGLVAYDPRFLAQVGHSPSELAGFIGSNGVYDVEAEYDFMVSRAPRITADHAIWQVMNGSREGLRQASPVRHVTPSAPRTLLLHGDIDRLVPVTQGQALYAALQAAGVPARWVSFPRKGHIDALFDGAVNAYAPFNNEVVAFTAADCTPAG